MTGWTRAQAPQGKEGEVVKDSVSIRADKNTDSVRLALAFTGDKLRVLAETAGWYEVELPRDYVMWVSKEFVAAGPDKEAVVNADNVSARAGAGMEFETLGHLNRGRRIEILEEKAGWLKFKFAAGDKGYVAKQFVRLEGEAGPRPATPIGKPPVVKPPPVEPVKPPEAEAEPDPKTMETFNRADKIYWKEVQKKNIADWDLEEARKLYLNVMEGTRNQSLKGTVLRRLAVIALAQRYREAPSTASDPREVLKEREKEIDAEYTRKRQILAEEIKRLYPTCIVVGRLEKLATTLPPITHKIVKDEHMTHLLYSPTIDLTIYEGKTVGIEGEVDNTLKWPLPAIKVTGVVLAPRKPESSEEKGEKQEGEAGKQPTEKQPD
jgi:uncharacterized protein YraI